MARAAASWLQTTIPLLDLGAADTEVCRSGNEHREFVPVNVYRTSDSWLFLAIGNDFQWKRLVSLEPFRSLARETRETNEGRKAERAEIHRELGALLQTHDTEPALSLLREAGLVVSPVNAIRQVRELGGIAEHLTRTELPDGSELRLPPTAVETGCQRLRLSPRFGEHTRRVLRETGLGDDEIEDLARGGVIH
jgi:crotonobetainyl-CoA:carnitine CoA-transferase CaiB-like acyl-CoA transferase